MLRQLTIRWNVIFICRNNCYCWNNCYFILRNISRILIYTLFLFILGCIWFRYKSIKTLFSDILYSLKLFLHLRMFLWISQFKMKYVFFYTYEQLYYSSHIIRNIMKYFRINYLLIISLVIFISIEINL